MISGGGINNKSTCGIANNTVAGGFENATASYGGWFISPEVTYGYRIPIKSVLVTPRLRVRYVGGSLDGFSESGSMQNLSVGRRAINDLEERAEVELSTVHPLAGGTMKALVNFGAIGLERLGNPNINTVLLAQSLSFTTPGERNAVGGVLGAGLEYWRAFRSDGEWKFAARVTSASLRHPRRTTEKQSSFCLSWSRIASSLFRLRAPHFGALQPAVARPASEGGRSLQ